MDKNKWWMLGAVLLIGITVVAGWLLGISPKLAETRAHTAERAGVEAQNVIYEAQLQVLEEQFAGMDALAEDLAELRRSVPSTADLPTFVGQLGKIAGASQVAITSIGVSDAQLLAPTAEEEAVDPAAEPVATTDAAGEDSASAAPADAPVAAPPELVTAENFVAVPIELSTEGNYGQVLNFLERLQGGERLVTVTSFSTTEGTAPGTVAATISALVYVLLNQDSTNTP